MFKGSGAAVQKACGRSRALKRVQEWHTESTENTEIIYSNTDRTDLTDFYIPLNFLIFCPAEMNSLIHLTSFYLIN